jgi:hypothetical protein
VAHPAQPAARLSEQDRADAGKRRAAAPVRRLRA